MNSMIQSTEERLTNLEERVSVLEAGRTTTSHVPLAPPIVKTMSPREFLNTKDLSTTIEITLALGYYLEHYSQVSPFTVEDLAGAFQAARKKLPANLNDMINKNMAKGLIMETAEQKGSKKAWILTDTGEKVIENNAQ